MKVQGRHHRSIEHRDGRIFVIDQRRLPHEFVVVELASLEQAAAAIRNLTVRGAPLIGVTAAYGLALGLAENEGDRALETSVATLLATRPTARNLKWALQSVVTQVQRLPARERAAAAMEAADALARADIETNEAIGNHGAAVLRNIWQARGADAPLEIATHCNAGWLGCVDWGTALAAIYKAHDSGIPLHVWVNETRPVNQGSRLTAWELAAHGVPHTLQVDSASGSRLRTGQVHACIVGADRVTPAGDVYNKIGTYLLALAAHDNDVPFYVAVPHSTFDPLLTNEAVEIEDRGAAEVTHTWGQGPNGERMCVRVAPSGTQVSNPAFDLTPARLLTGIVTDRGVITKEELRDGAMRAHLEERRQSSAL